MKRLLKALGLVLGLSMPILAAPTSGPAGIFIVNVSTTVSQPAFNVSSGTISSNFYLPSLTQGQCHTTTTGGLVVSVPCGSGAASIAVTTGTAAGFSKVISSPTAVIVFDSNTFTSTLTGAASNYIGLLNPFLTTSSATATYLQISSATATYLQQSSATATYLQDSSATITYIQVSTTLAVAHGGTGTSSPGLIAGTNITSITGTWPNQVINASNANGSNVILNQTSVQSNSSLNVSTGVFQSSFTVNAPSGAALNTGFVNWNGSEAVFENAYNNNACLIYNGGASGTANDNLYITADKGVGINQAPISGQDLTLKNIEITGTCTGAGCVSGSSVTLPYSGVAFGSSSNTVTSDTNSITWTDATQQLVLYSSYTVPNFTPPGDFANLYLLHSPGTTVSSSPGILFGHSQNPFSSTSQDTAILQHLDVGYGSGHVYQQEILLLEFQYPFSSIPIWDVVYDTTTGHSTFTVTGMSLQGLSLNQFVTTDGNTPPDLVSFNLFGGTNTWTAQQIFDNQLTISTSIIDGTGSFGTSGQVLSSQGYNQPVKWVNQTGGSGGSSIYPATATASFPYGESISTIVFTGSGNSTITESNGVAGQIVLSTTVPTYGQLPILSSSMTLIATPLRSTLLAVDSNGVLISSTVTGGGGSPAGGNYAVQTDSNSAFGGNSNFQYDGSTITIVTTTYTITGVSEQDAVGVLFNYTASSMTISSFTVTGGALISSATFNGPGAVVITTNTYLGGGAYAVLLTSNTIMAGTTDYYGTGGFFSSQAVTLSSAVTLGGGAYTTTISSNAILGGTTFYGVSGGLYSSQPVTLSSAVTLGGGAYTTMISSNAILGGTTFYGLYGGLYSSQPVTLSSAVTLGGSAYTVNITSNGYIGSNKFYQGGANFLGVEGTTTTISGGIMSPDWTASRILQTNASGNVVATTVSGALVASAIPPGSMANTVTTSSFTVTGMQVYVSSTVIIPSAGLRVLAAGAFIKLAPEGLAVNTLMTGLPTISTATTLNGNAAWADGTYIVVSGTSSFTPLLLQDNGTLSGSELNIDKHPYVTVSSTQSAAFMYNASSTMWNYIGGGGY